VDETHHVRAESYRRILEFYPDAIVLGLTATPCRGDGRGLGNVFEVLIGRRRSATWSSKSIWCRP
jgi:superfamily II DNA or RNA helicase